MPAAPAEARNVPEQTKPLAWTGRKPGCGPASVLMASTICRMTVSEVADVGMCVLLLGLALTQDASTQDDDATRSILTEISFWFSWRQRIRSRAAWPFAWGALERRLSTAPLPRIHILRTAESSAWWRSIPWEANPPCLCVFPVRTPSRGDYPSGCALGRDRRTRAWMSRTRS